MFDLDQVDCADWTRIKKYLDKSTPGEWGMCRMRGGPMIVSGWDKLSCHVIRIADFCEFTHCWVHGSIAVELHNIGQRLHHPPSELRPRMRRLRQLVKRYRAKGWPLPGDVQLLPGGDTALVCVDGASVAQVPPFPEISEMLTNAELIANAPADAIRVLYGSAAVADVKAAPRPQLGDQAAVA